MAITYELVAAAIGRIRTSKNPSVTDKRIRKELGDTGGMSTIVKYRRQFFENERTSMEVPAVPDKFRLVAESLYVIAHEAAKEQFSEQIGKLKGQADAANEEALAHATALDALTAQLAEKSVAYDQLNETVARLDLELNASNTALAAQSTGREAAEMRATHLEGLLASAERDRAQERAALAQSAAAATKAASEHSTAQAAQLDELRASLEARDSEIKDLHRQLAAATSPKPPAPRKPWDSPRSRNRKP